MSTEEFFERKQTVYESSPFLQAFLDEKSTTYPDQWLDSLRSRPSYQKLETSLIQKMGYDWESKTIWPLFNSHARELFDPMARSQAKHATVSLLFLLGFELKSMANISLFFHPILERFSGTEVLNCYRPLTDAVRNAQLHSAIFAIMEAGAMTTPNVPLLTSPTNQIPLIYTLPALYQPWPELDAALSNLSSAS